MKPRLFVGSSVESLKVSNAIQENLQYDADATVWTQGIFELSSNTLDDLLKCLSETDFAIFVFKHDDVTQMRSSTISTVRDNVVFELGLFIGRLGKDKVFFVVPNGEKNNHLPTDLTGILPGYYNENREEGNLLAALGPFCNQVRRKLESFVFENLNDLINESKDSKAIAANKPKYWEYLLLSQMLQDRLVSINKSYLELDKGLLFIRTKLCSAGGFRESCQELLGDIQKLVLLFTKLLTQETEIALGPPGVPGKVLDIKNLADKFAYLSKELLSWEYSLQELKPPDELAKVKDIMRKWPRAMIRQLNIFPSEMKKIIQLRIDTNNESTEKMKLTLKLIIDSEDVDGIISCFYDYFGHP